MASITVTDLTIGGVTMPTPALEGLTISSEKIWSSDTGRSSSGKMLGTIVAIKTTVKIKWPTLTMAEVAVIEAAVSDADNPFVAMQYTDMTGKTVTKTVYFGTPTYTIYSGADNLQWVENVEVEGIEQ
ncbi:MAG: hypothetical protein LUD83_01895 [Clostridiales bacterium]|nr:hypothetical protein [Clostridiales bacterium]